MQVQDVIHHTRAVARAVSAAFVAADLPVHSYDSPDLALQNARLLIEAGAQGVKLEGGRACSGQIQAITNSGIPFLGHIGMLPQHVVEEGGYRTKGPQLRGTPISCSMKPSAIEENGGFAVVLRTDRSIRSIRNHPGDIHPNNRDRLRGGMRRADPGLSRSGGVFSVVQTQTRETGRQRRGRDPESCPCLYRTHPRCRGLGATLSNHRTVPPGAVLLSFKDLSHPAKFFVALFEQGIDRFVPQLIEMGQELPTANFAPRIHGPDVRRREVQESLRRSVPALSDGRRSVSALRRFRRMAAMFPENGSATFRADHRVVGVLKHQNAIGDPDAQRSS